MHEQYQNKRLLFYINIRLFIEQLMSFSFYSLLEFRYRLQIILNVKKHPQYYENDKKNVNSGSYNN